MKRTDSLKRYWQANRFSFFAGVVCALVVHLYFFTNTLPNYDTLVTQHSYNFGLSLGRWTQAFGSILSSAYALPWVTGVLCTVYLGLLCMLVTDVLEVRTKLGQALTCALLTAFPALASYFGFLFIADSGSMGIMLAALAVKLCKDTKWGVLTGGIVLGFSTGFYQAHLSYGMVLMAVSFALQILSGKLETPKALVKQALMYLATAVVGAVSYYVGFRLCLLLTGYVLPDSYQDIGSLLSPSIDLGKSFSVSWGEVLGNFRSHLPFLRRLRTPLLALSGVAILGASGTLICRNRLYKKPLHLAALALLVPLTAMALTAPSFLSANVGYHSVMRVPWSLLFVGIVPLCERAFPPVTEGTVRRKGTLFCRMASLVLTGLLAWNFWIVSNMAYLNMQQRYERDYANMVRVLDRLEQREDFSLDTPVVFLGVSEELTAPLFADEPAIGELTAMDGPSMLRYPSVYHEFLRYYLGVELPYAGDEAAVKLAKDSTVQAMPCWPDKDAIRNVDGVLVVKMGE